MEIDAKTRQDKYSRTYAICLPDDREGTTGEIYANKLRWYILPKTIFDHKTYPICTQCKSRYVPIKKGDKECFKCNFLKE